MSRNSLPKPFSAFSHILPPMDNRTFVLDLQAKGYEVWDGCYPSDPELEDLHLKNIHTDSDRETMGHVRFGHFMDAERYYFRKDNPETRHRFYIVRPVTDMEASLLMLKILLGVV